MPRPTTAQVFYGSLTVVLATLVMLLVTDARSGAAVVALAAVGLLLGLAVAVLLAAAAVQGRPAAEARPPAAAPVPRARVGSSAESRVTEPSLRR
jgi:hypothetical protein